MYRSSRPATAQTFRDRAQELERLTQAVAALVAGEPTWIALVGRRKIGKTSLLLELARRCPHDDVAFALLDTFEETPVSPAVFRRCALRVLDATLGRDAGVSFESLARTPPEYRAALVSAARFVALPPPVRATLLELPDLPLHGDALRSLLDLPEQLAEALGLRVVVAWDEFQELAGLGRTRGGVDPFPLMRAVWQRHGRVLYVISGSERTMLQSLVTDRASPFFQQFALMELGEFPRAEAIALLREGAPPDRPVSEALAARAVDVLGGHPFYLQLLGEALTALAPPYDEAALKQAVQELLFTRAGRLALYFEGQFRLLVGRSTYLAATLAALAARPRRLTDVANEIGARSGETASYLDRLGDAVERRDDGSYALVDRTFGLWLDWRRPGGTVVPMTTLGDDAERKVASSLARMGFDLVYQSRASRGAFDLLATRGASQLGVQVKRRVLPLRFRSEEWSRMEAEARRLGWSWVVAAAPPPPDERLLFLDPARARQGAEARLDEAATIDNLLLWLDRPRRA